MVHAEQAPPALQLTFWRTLYRYLLSIVASLLTGALWLGLTRGLVIAHATIVPQVVHLGVYATIFSGVLALAAGFLAMNFLWLSLDLSRPAPPGVDPRSREIQLLILWFGVPLAVVGVFLLVAVAAIAVGSLAYPHGLPAPG